MAAIVAVVAALVVGRRTSADVLAALTSLRSEAVASKTVGESLAQRIESFERTMDQRIAASHALLGQNLNTMQQHSAASTKALQSVGENLGKVFEASQKIEKLATGVTRLEDLLKPPKVRGLLGETFLEEALKQVLPPGSWEMQKKFSDGVVVDAAISIGGRIVSVDSKFPLENYRRALEDSDEGERKRAGRQFVADVKKHADTIAEKYIRPSEGTYDFALMYVPAEAVYCEIVADSDERAVADYAVSRRVIPVSPRLFYAYLFTVAQGLKGLEIEQRTKEIRAGLEALQRSFGKVSEPFQKLGGHLSNTQKQYEEAGKQLSRFGDRLDSVGQGEKLEGADKLEETPVPPLRLFPQG